jgi:pyruvate dehydrogenase E2 component (dihydrolipoamide acetyltransferase)
VPALTAEERAGGRPKSHASPSVRRFARELGVDLSQVEGSGPKGRVLRDDVQTFVKKVMTRSAPTASLGVAIAEAPVIDFAKFGEVELRPLTRIKKKSAANLHRAWVTIPHVTQFDEADITELEDFRKAQVDKLAKQGVKLTLLAFLMKAAVVALKEHPELNASLDPSGEGLILKKYIHIGVAVDTPDGLVVPVIRDVDRKGLFQLAAELGEVSARARDKKLMPGDMQGGSFSISSLGGIGGTAFTPIVNSPEVAILGIARAAIRPVYQDGTFVPRLILPIALSYDHRVIDGAAGARFTSTLRSVLTDIRQMLL